MRRHSFAARAAATRWRGRFVERGTGSRANADPGRPSHPAAVITAIEAEIARAVLGGLLDAEVALRLADDLRALEQRVESGKDRDVRRRAEDLNERIHEEVNDGEFDAGLCDRLTGLLDTP